MRVITIWSDSGSGGGRIADRVAKSLGFAVVDEDASDRILREYGLTKFNELYDSAPSILDLVRVENLVIISMYNEILEGLARRGGLVILSRVGFAVLGGYADVLNVRVVAPITLRIERLQANPGAAATTVEAQIHEDDNAHRMFVQRFYNRNPDEQDGYGLVIDTGLTTADDAVRQIVEAALATTGTTPTAGATMTSTIQVDPVLESAIAEVLEHPMVDAAG